MDGWSGYPDMEHPSYFHTAFFLADGRIGQTSAPSDSIHTIQWLSESPKPLPDDSPVLVALRFIAYSMQGHEKLARPLKLNDIQVETLPVSLIDRILDVKSKDIQENGQQCCWVTVMDSRMVNHVLRLVFVDGRWKLYDLESE